MLQILNEGRHNHLGILKKGFYKYSGRKSEAMTVGMFWMPHSFPQMQS